MQDTLPWKAHQGRSAHVQEISAQHDQKESMIQADSMRLYSLESVKRDFYIPLIVYC